MTGRKRFLSKQTANNQRLEFLAEMFPDACFVHIIRDGRAVTNSLNRVQWWNQINIWWLGSGTEQWLRNGGDPVELGALCWERDVREIRRVAGSLPGRYLEIRYEQLTADVQACLRDVMKFCRLSFPQKMQKIIPCRLPDMNSKWQTELLPAQQEVITKTVSPLLTNLGYLEQTVHHG